MAEPAWYLPAQAKINLGLRVLSRRPDGYHEIDTWMHSIALHDDLWGRARPLTEVTGDAVQVDITKDEAVTGLPVAAGPDNLVVRAANAFLEHTGFDSRVGLQFALHKRIPAGGGLGGGSADAAAALRLANVACGEPLAMRDLHGIAASLGADVPFFLAGGTQRARGVGDVLEPLRGPEVPFLHLVLVMPSEGSATADVYRKLQLPRGGGRPLRDAPRFADGQRFGNDLEETALSLTPSLSRVRDRALELGADSIELSGSGSTFFVVCAARSHLLTRQALAPLTAELGARVAATTSATLFGPPRRTGWRELPEGYGESGESSSTGEEQDDSGTTEGGEAT